MKTSQEKIKEMKEVKMTPFEKASIRLRVAEHMESTPLINQSKNTKTPTKSPYVVKSHFNIFPLLIKGLAFVLIAVVIGGGTATFASQQALPGDALYPLKINVTEKIVGALTANTPEKKIIYQKTLVERRMSEMESLASAGKLSDTNSLEAELALSKQVNELNTTIANNRNQVPVATIAQVESDLIPKFENNKTMLAGNIAMHIENKGGDHLLARIDTEKMNIAQDLNIGNNQVATLSAPSEDNTVSSPVTENPNQNTNPVTIRKSANPKTNKDTGNLGIRNRGGDDSGSEDGNEGSESGGEDDGGGNSALPATDSGVLSGTVTIGPICPVDVLGGVPCKTNPAVYTSRGITITDMNTNIIAKKVNFDVNGKFNVILPVGNYKIEETPSGMDRVSDFPKIVTITANSNTILNFSIDTGIR